MKYINIFKITALTAVFFGISIYLYSNVVVSEGSTENYHQQQTDTDSTMGNPDKNQAYEVQKTEEEWRKELTREEYRILRNKGTELPYVNEYYKTEKEGIYVCAACGKKLFSSETKYHSGSGWPAFYAPVDNDAIETKADNSMFMTRTEVLCNRCGSHLGHVFEDGPDPTGLRYCINSVAMDLIKQDVD